MTEQVLMNKFQGFGRELIHEGDFVLIAHSGYMNLGYIYCIDGVSVTTREMFGWYNSSSSPVKGYRKDGLLMLTTRTRNSRYRGFVFFPLSNDYKYTEFGDLFCRSYKKKFKEDI